jgi:hypothetical protein
MFLAGDDMMDTNMTLSNVTASNNMAYGTQTQPSLFAVVGVLRHARHANDSETLGCAA